MLNYVNTHSTAIDACENENPCRNNGTCIDRVDEMGYDCVCTDRFDGHRCEEEVVGMVCDYYSTGALHTSQQNELKIHHYYHTAHETEPPTIIHPPQNIEAKLMIPVKLTCTAEGYPTPTYKWYKDGDVLPDKIRSFLYIDDPLPQDRGNYTCVAINAVGNYTSKVAKLDITGKSSLYTY